MINAHSPKLDVIKLTGEEKFSHEGKELGFDALAFWRWSVSDIASNATRGILAEFIVAQALGIEIDVRNEWDDYDLTTKDGIKIEVKSSAYIQTWAQEKDTSPQFDISLRTHITLPGTGRYITKDNPSRIADVYIFALMKGKITKTNEPLNLDHWEFYVVKKEILDEHRGNKKKISLEQIKKIDIKGVSFDALRDTLKQVTA